MWSDNTGREEELRVYFRILSLDNVEASQRMSLDLLVQRFLPCTNMQGREPLRLAHSTITHRATPKTLTYREHTHLNQLYHTDNIKLLTNILKRPAVAKSNHAYP